MKQPSGMSKEASDPATMSDEALSSRALLTIDVNKLFYLCDISEVTPAIQHRSDSHGDVIFGDIRLSKFECPAIDKMMQTGMVR